MLLCLHLVHKEETTYDKTFREHPGPAAIIETQNIK